MSLHNLYTMLLLTQAPALRCKPIITQIGRENNISAENYVSRTVEDAGPYNLVNILMRTSLMQMNLFLACHTKTALKNFGAVE